MVTTDRDTRETKDLTSQRLSFRSAVNRGVFIRPNEQTYSTALLTQLACFDYYLRY